MTYLFVFRAYPDIDHMAPVAWKLLEEGEEVHVVLSQGSRFEGDHRIELLRRYPRFRLHHARPTLPWAVLRLWRSHASVLAVEWGYGLPAGYEAFPRPAGLWALARRLGRSLLRARDPKQTRANFIAAGVLLGVPTVCLPHGLSITAGLDITADRDEEIVPTPEDIEQRGEHRNRFAAFVLNTEHHRRYHLMHTLGDPAVLQTWGSARFSPEWFELNRRLVPPFEWPEPAGGRVRVAFLLPRWRRQPDDGEWAWGGWGAPRVRGEGLTELIRRLAELPEVSLALAGHPRSREESSPPPAGAGESPGAGGDPSTNGTGIHDVTGTSSVSLIAAADIVVDLGSSIALEAVLQGKALLIPSYLYAPKTLFDAVPGAGVVAGDVEEAVGYVRAHAAGAPRPAPPDAKAELMRRMVYGNRPAPFDVLGVYARRLRELGGAPGIR